MFRLLYARLPMRTLCLQVNHRISNAASARRSFSAPSAEPLTPQNSIEVHWTMGDGQTIKVRGKLGESLLDTARREDIELEGACEGSVACSTCHVVLESQVFDALQEATDEENDMLDLAYGLTQTSRLGCQVKLTKEFDGMKVKVPSATRNMAVDGHKPKHH